MIAILHLSPQRTRLDQKGNQMKALVRLAATALCAVSFVLASHEPMVAQQSKTLRVVMHAGVRLVDPITTTAYIARDHGYMIYDTLFSTDEKLEIKPQMVDTYEVSSDRLTWTFKLRDGLKFHDGANVTSEDVIASLQRWGKVDGMGQSLLSFTAEMKAVDARTFQILLKEPFGFVLEALGKPSSNVPFITPKRIAMTPHTQPITEYVGSGPFRFATNEWQAGVRAVYLKFDDYRPRSEPANGLAGGKVARVDRVEWISIGDAQTTMNALLRGEIDVWEMPPHDLLPILQSNRGVVVKDRNKLAHISLLRFNWLQPPFDNVKIRQAVLHAIKQEDYLLAQVGDSQYYRECGAMLGCGTPFDSSKGAIHLGNSANLEAARKLLQEGGYRGEKIVILQPTDVAIVAPLGPVTAQALRAIGMNVELQSMDWTTMVLRRANPGPVDQGGWHIFHTAQAAADLMNPVANNYLRGQGRNGGFFGWTEDAEMERLRASIARETDPAKQKALAQAAHDRAYEMLPYIPLGLYIQPPAYRSNISGFVNAPAMVFWNVEKK